MTGGTFAAEGPSGSGAGTDPVFHLWLGALLKDQLGGVDAPPHRCHHQRINLELQRRAHEGRG